MNLGETINAGLDIAKSVVTVINNFNKKKHSQNYFINGKKLISNFNTDYSEYPKISGVNVINNKFSDLDDYLVEYCSKYEPIPFTDGILLHKSSETSLKALDDPIGYLVNVNIHRTSTGQLLTGDLVIINGGVNYKYSLERSMVKSRRHNKPAFYLNYYFKDNNTCVPYVCLRAERELLDESLREVSSIYDISKNLMGTDKTIKALNPNGDCGFVILEEK